MAGVARLDTMAAQAARRLGLGLPSMAREKVGRMNEGLVDLFCFAHLYTQALRDIVAVVTTLGGVALRTLHSGLERLSRVLFVPTSAMAQHGSREQLLEVRAVVAGRALAAVPLVLVFMTRKAPLHWGEGVARLVGHQTCMTGNALPSHFGHGQVSVVVEHDSGRLLRRGRARSV